MKPTRPILRYHGGKWRLAPWIISHFPSHRVYVEPFGGAASVLMHKAPSYAEVYNDLDGDIVNVMRVLRSPLQRAELEQALVMTPYARDEFVAAIEPSECPVERARRTIVRAEMGFGSAGATKGQTGFRIDTKRAHSTAMHVWARVPDNIAAFGRRLHGVLIENRDAVQLLRDHDTPQTLFYVDPPYVHGTRQMGGGSRAYRHEMDDAQHEQLLAALVGLQGMVILSGYPSPMYDKALHGWRRMQTQSRIAAGRGTAIRTEVLWLSPSIAPGGLFTDIAA